MNFYETHIFPVLNDAVTGDFEHFRRELFSRAKGKVLEVGVGSALGHEFYGPQVSEIIGLDPNPGMIDRARDKVTDTRFSFQTGHAESLPFEDDSFDTVICFLVLCSVEDMQKSLEELKRVLRPDGEILFLEHIAPKPGMKRSLFNTINPLWRIPACGCNLNRETMAEMEKADLKVEWEFLPSRINSLVPFVWGHACL